MKDLLKFHVEAETLRDIRGFFLGLFEIQMDPESKSLVASEGTTFFKISKIVLKK